MMKAFRLGTLFALILNALACFGQKQGDVQNAIEYILEHFQLEETSNFDLTELEKTLDEYLSRPLKINACTEDEMLMMPLVQLEQAKRISVYREKYGSIIGPEEWNRVEFGKRNQVDVPKV